MLQRTDVPTGSSMFYHNKKIPSMAACERKLAAFELQNGFLFLHFYFTAHLFLAAREACR